MSRVPLPRRLLGPAAPLAVWALHFVVMYGLQGLACGRGTPAPDDVATWLLVATVAALVAIAALAVRGWRALRRDRDGIAAASFGAALLAGLAVAFTATPAFLLPPCA